MTHRRAGEILGLGRFLDECDHFAEAALTGELSGSQITLARRTGKSNYDDIMRETQAGLADALKELDIQQTARAVDHWIARADALLDEKAPPIEHPCELTYNTALDDVTHGTFRLNEAAGLQVPGCDRPVKWTDAHHIRHWEHGGSTDYDNLILLCSRHHHYVHQQRVDIDLMPNGEAFFTTHDGSRTHSRPRGAPPDRHGRS